MAPTRPYRSRARHYAPPPSLFPENGKLQTSQKCGVLWAKAFQQEGIRVLERAQSRILAEKEPRTCHNQFDQGPDPRGRKRTITRSDTAAIANYLDDPTTSLDNKGTPWLDIVVEAGVVLAQTTHFKPPRLCTVNTKPIARAYKEDEDILNTIYEEEKELISPRAKVRRSFIEQQFILRPHLTD